MCAQDPVKHRQLFRQIGDFDEDLTIPDEQLLEKSNKRAILPYSIGCWVTAHARMALEEGIRLAHGDGCHFIYADTDSVKYIGDIDWTAYNTARIKECQESGAMAVDPKGITHYMGVFETEDDPDTGYCYYQFKTLGAKKYAFVKKPVEAWKETVKIGDTDYTYTKIGPGRTQCTIAGVNKKLGGKELDKHGGLSWFRDGSVFREAGGTKSVYNDAPEISEMQIDGHTLRITSNVAILPSEYTLGITGEYERIIDYWKSYLDNPYII